MDMQLSIEKLKHQRELRAWTQSHLAEVSDISLRTIQRIEKSGVASQDSAQSICAAFEINIEDLLVSIPKEEKKTPKQTKYDPKFLIPAIVTMGMAVSFKFNEQEAAWLWKNEPGVGIAFGCISISLFIILFYKSKKSRSV